MTNRLFFYIGAKLLGEGPETPAEWYEGPVGRDWYEGFEQAAEFFERALKPERERWYYLLEHSSRTKDELGNMCFRMFAPFRELLKDAAWTPDARPRFEAPVALGAPLRITSHAERWEFVCSSIQINAKAEVPAKTFNIARTGRAPVNTTKNGLKVALLNNLSDCSGRVVKTELDDFVEAIKPILPYPLFSVSDCNTFHTTGYLWGKLALDRSWAANTSGAVLAVDIDQHNDSGSDTSGIVSSDGWGHPLIKNYDKGAYVVLGLATNEVDNVNVYTALRKATKNVSTVKCKKEVDGGGIFEQVATTLTPRLLRGPFVPILQALTKLLDDLEGLLADTFKHVYITVDRDSMFGSRTHWKDRDVTFKDPAEIINVLDALVCAMAARGVRLAGFDVTGLPEEDRGDCVTSKLLKETDSRLKRQVIADLKQEIGDYTRRFDLWVGPGVYRIKATGASADDSLLLDYELKHTVTGVVQTGLRLDKHGRAGFLAEKVSDLQIRFPGLSDFGPIRLDTSLMLTGARYSYEITRLP